MDRFEERSEDDLPLGEHPEVGEHFGEGYGLIGQGGEAEAGEDGSDNEAILRWEQEKAEANRQPAFEQDVLGDLEDLPVYEAPQTPDTPQE